MAKRRVKKYSPSEKDILDYRYCINKGVAYVMEKNISGSYYIKRLYLSKDKTSDNNKKDSYLRIDTSKSDRKYNRITLNENDAWIEVFRLYSLTKNKI